MSAQNELNTTACDEAAFWTTVVDSGEMSEEQRVDFHAWLDEPRNARALSEVRTLVSLIQELPEKKAYSLSRLPIARAWFPGLLRVFDNDKKKLRS